MDGYDGGAAPPAERSRNRRMMGCKITAKNKHEKRLLELLRELDTEMQYLGIRGDWGWSDEPLFTSGTLVATVKHEALRTDYPESYLLDVAKRLINIATEPTQKWRGDDSPDRYWRTAQELHDEAVVLSGHFVSLIEDYRKARENVLLKRSSNGREEPSSG